MSITGGIPFIGFLSPTDEGDQYPVTKPKYGLGGLRSVGSQNDLYSIPIPRREQGMIAFVVNQENYWSLIGGTADENWQIAEFEGPTGPTGPPVNFTFGLSPPSDAILGDYFLGASGSGTYEGNLYIFARLDTDPESDGEWWEISGVRGDDGDDGATGVQGFQGFQGNQGLQGFQGNIGITGVQGFQGFQGFQGNQGLQGFQGNIGTTGVQGFQGFQGFQGNQGFQGFQGNIGITGVQGFQGFQGFQGNQGFQGFQGLIGVTGVQGFQGNQGFQGFQGLIGVTGVQGVQGFQGFQGSKGSGKYFYGPTAPESTDDGLTLGSKWFNTEIGAEFTYIVEGDSTTQWVMVNVFSATGPQGPLGGGTGNQGFQGFQGNIGITGTQGFQGFQGLIGVTGVQGFQGFQGNIGITGVQGFQGFQGNIGITGEGYTSAEIRDNYLYVTKVFSDGTTSEVNLGYIGPTGSGFVFDADITAAFGPNKTFGKYEDGDLIPSLGKTAVQVIKEALFDVLSPTVSLTSPTTIQFNQTSISNVLNYSHTINTLGAGIASGTIEWKRANETSYTSLTSGTSASGSYTHSTTNAEFNTNAFNYKYTVIDTAGGSASADLTINVQAYAAPSVSITQTGVSVTSPETNTKREKGNVATNISATITKNSAFVPITYWKFQYNEDNGSWLDTGFSGATDGNPSNFNTGTTSHSPTNTVSSVKYRVVVEDDYSGLTSNPSSTISFKNLIFYGSQTSSYPINSTEVRNLQYRVFEDGTNPFSLFTGLEHRFFVAAMPQPITIVSALDADALNASMPYATANTNLTSINNFAGTSTSYNVYGMSIAQYYTDQNGNPTDHEHVITRS